MVFPTEIYMENMCHHQLIGSRWDGKFRPSRSRVLNWMPPTINHQVGHCKPSGSIYNRQHILLQAVTAATVSSFFLYSMSKPTRENTIWDEKETDCMMEYLHDHASEAGDGGNFKDSEYLAAAVYIALYHRSGPVKTVKHIKTKYRSVSVTQ